MSPEQTQPSAHVDARSDIYSLGCVLYELLAGSPPFSGTAQVVQARHVGEAPPKVRVVRPDLSAGVERALLHSLAKQPAERPHNA